MDNPMDQSTVLFDLGRVVVTPGALQAMGDEFSTASTLIKRHATGDPGVLDSDDQETNARAITDGSRVFSAYELQGTKYYVITESDRSVTTLLLPEEY